jgi:peptidoglycan/xylan/chitin deacetylase (PgdA/CDA1 family)
VAALLAVAGCHGPVPSWAGPGSAQPTPGGGSVRTGTPTATATPKPTPSPSSTALTLAAALARMPKFGPPPPAVPIRLANGPTATMFYRLPVGGAKVAFLTMDDGIYQLPDDLTLMKAAHIPFTMFLIGPVAQHNPAFFKQLEADGGVIEDHTLTHPDLKGMPEATQQHEICGARSMLGSTFGRTPIFFRPPYGSFDPTTLAAVHECGLQAAFCWRETVRDGVVYYQTKVHQIQPGDIVLMHFRTTFTEDLLAALTAIHDAGLTPALLEDYIED